MSAVKMEDDMEMSLAERFRNNLSELAGGNGTRELVVFGAGKMASALIDAFVNKDCFSKDEIVPITHSQKSASNWIGKGFSRALTLVDYMKIEPNEAKRIIMIGVKPQTRMELFEILSMASNSMKCCVILSILAGVEHSTLLQELAFLGNVPIVRLLPSVPSAIGAGITLMYSNNQRAIEVSTSLLQSAGDVFVLPEAQINAASAVAGSGPAFCALLAEGLADGAVCAGLPRDKALQMTLLMLKGSAQLMLETGLHPAQLKDNVCSAGGTTVRGVRELERGGVRSALIEAVMATKARADELGAVKK